MTEKEPNKSKEIEALKRHITILEHVLAATDVHFTVHDREGVYLYVNPVGLAAQNMRWEDVVGKTWRQLGFPEPVGIAFDQRLERVFTEGVSVRHETEFPTPAGPRIFETVMHPGRDENGEIVVSVVTLQDITHLREAEEALRKSNEELAAALATAQELRKKAEQINRAKDIFLANMSHEFRTPLNAILGYSQLMAREENITPTQQEHLETIIASGEHLLGLINDVLTMSKIEAGRTTLQEKSFDLHRQIQSLQEIFQLITDHKGIRLLVKMSPEVPKYIYADDVKLRQVLMNLLSNVIKFTDEGSVTLQADCQRLDADSDKAKLLVEVKDTGVGIASEEMELLFEPFIQTTSGQNSQEGTGLGLPISKQFVMMMGGELKVSSSPGEGTVFQVQIPVHITEEDAAEAEAPQPPRRAGQIEPGQTAPDGKPYRLLVVEDKATNRDLLVNLLTLFGFEVRAAVNGAEGVEIWEQWRPHLIWMDMRMPVMDGYEAARIIKARSEAASTPTIIVALTASVFEEDREEILAAGCDDFIRKPFHENDITEALHRHLGIRFAYPTIAPQAEAKKSLAFDALSSTIWTLPTEWRAKLYKAIVALNIEEMVAAIESVRPQEPALADTLLVWVNNFEYDKIIKLITPGA